MGYNSSRWRKVKLVTATVARLVPNEGEARMDVSGGRTSAVVSTTTPEVSDGFDGIGHPLDGRVSMPSRAAEDLVALHRELIASALRGEGVAGLAAALRRRTGYDVLVQDAAGHTLASTAAIVGPISPGGVADIFSSRPPRPAVRYKQSWFAAVHHDKELLGAVVLWDPDCAAREFALVALEDASPAFALEFLRLRSIAEIELTAWGDLATEVLDSPHTDKVRSHARRLGYDPDQPQRAVVIEASNSGDADVQARLRDELARLGQPRTLLTVHKGSLVALVAEELDWVGLGAALSRRSAPPLRIGVGGKYELAAMSRSVADAKFALRLTAALDKAGPVAPFDDLGIWRVFASNVESHGLQDLVSQRIGPLISYDEKHRAELVKTVATYLNRACEIEATAIDLHVHRNTLTYRLKRIADIAGINLTDPDHRFQVDLACRAWRTMQALTPN
jgi:hypothetical protein